MLLFNFIQIIVVNPAMDRALEFLQKFAIDVHNGKISEDRLRFGAAWRHPPQIDDPKLHKQWAKLQLMDFVQSLANTEFAVSFLFFYQFYFGSNATIVFMKMKTLEQSYIKHIKNAYKNTMHGMQNYGIMSLFFQFLFVKGDF